MARPRKIKLLQEKAAGLSKQLGEALRVLGELRGCLERLASLSVDPVYASLAEKRKYTEYGEYSYPVLQFCDPGSSPWEGGCQEVYVTRYRDAAEALVAVDDFARNLAQLAIYARWVLGGLDKVEEDLARLEEFLSGSSAKVSPSRQRESDEAVEEVAAVG